MLAARGSGKLTSRDRRVVYWDSSAILSVLFQDVHSAEAMEWARAGHVHLLSSLGQAEIHAVVGRLRREKQLAPLLLEAALQTLEGGPWRQVKEIPRPSIIQTLAKNWPLRGADLWHLALAKSLQLELPELVLLTFDSRLHRAAEGEGLAA